MNRVSGHTNHAGGISADVFASVIKPMIVPKESVADIRARGAQRVVNRITRELSGALICGSQTNVRYQYHKESLDVEFCIGDYPSFSISIAPTARDTANVWVRSGNTRGLVGGRADRGVDATVKFVKRLIVAWLTRHGTIMPEDMQRIFVECDPALEFII